MALNSGLVAVPPLGQSLASNPFFLLTFATTALFVGSAFVYMSEKSPYFWGVLYYPGLALLVVFALTALATILRVFRVPAEERA